MKHPLSKPANSVSLVTFTTRGAAVAVLLFLGTASLHAQGNDQRAPEVPVGLEAPGATNKVHFHVYAIGLQVYHWSAAANSWGNSVPDATLFDADGNIVGSHFAGPTWQSLSGSFVKGARVAGSTPDTNAIPWLLLKATTNSPSGIFSEISYIQRINTVGGKAPNEPGAFDGQQFDSPYATEYYFYRPDPRTLNRQE